MGVKVDITCIENDMVDVMPAAVVAVTV